MDDKAPSSAPGSVPAVVSKENLLKFQDSSFSHASPSGSPAKIASNSAGKTNSSYLPPGNAADENFSAPSGPEGERLVPPGGSWNFLGISYYRPYFDVDTSDVVERILESMRPLSRSNFLEKTALNPDMYGPFWICTTLIFATAALGNLSSYLTHTALDNDPSRWHYDISAVSSASTILYGYTALIPLGLFFLLGYLKVPTGLVQLWCLYGYSLFVFIPTSLLCIIPLDIARWIFVALATTLSTSFLVLNLRAQISQAYSQWALIVGSATALHVILGFILKMYFFTYSAPEALQSP